MFCSGRLGVPPVTRNNLPDFGASLHARIDRADGGWRASYRILHSDGKAAVSDARIFAKDRDAGAWLYDEGRRRGFQIISIEFGDERDED
jgi:hypothetical protein